MDGLTGPADAAPLGEIVFAEPAPALIVKWIQTAQALSVQNHPRQGPARKNEWWYVAEAEPDAYLLLGLKVAVDRGGLAAAARDGSIIDLLHRVFPRRGDAFFVPAGTIHALGPGLTVVEVQEPSDTTFRLYDYGRARELHLEAGVSAAVLDAAPVPGCAWPAEPFGVEALDLAAGAGVAVDAGDYLIPVSGVVDVGGARMAAGDCWRGGAPADVIAATPARVLIAKAGTAA